MDSNDSVLVFGLDGATFKILDPLIKKGKTPTIASLINQGCRAILESTIPPLTGAAWVTFQTGSDPGKHGITEFIKRDGSLISAPDIRLPKIWQIIAKTGLTSCVINMPVTYPVEPINGVLVSSLLTPPNESFVSPAAVESELREVSYRVDLDDPFKLEERKMPKKKIIEEIKSLIHGRGRAAIMLVKRQPWDFFFVLFRATDLIQHLDFDGLETAKVYQLIDSYIEKIIVSFQKKYSQRNLHILIISDHGFHKQAEQDVAFYSLLRSLSIISSVPAPILKMARFVRRSLKINLKPTRVTSYGMFEPDLKKRDAIVEKLKRAKVNNRKIFQIVTTAKELYGTRYHHNIPDILWLTQPSFAPNADPLSDRLIYPKHSPLKGHHFSDRLGIFIANSLRIKSKRTVKKVTLPQVSSLICELLKVPYPDYFVDQPFYLG